MVPDGYARTTMASKKCPKCGKNNPHFFTNCVDCGAVLNSDTRKAKKINPYLKIGLVLCVVVILVILVIFVILPAVQYSHTVGQNFSETVSAKSAAVSPIPEYPLNQQVENGNLQITINSARDGQNTYNSNKFFIASVYLKNNRTAGNVQFYGTDFELIDSEGTKYYPYGIGSRVMYDLSPSQSSPGELTYMIPQRVTGKKIQFTFPAASALASDRDVVAFLI
jgi:predicted nucleic acid-binding Zn ribbon protein